MMCWCTATLAILATLLQGCWHNQCSQRGEDCRRSQCCAEAGQTCFEKNIYWASCKANCTPGLDPSDQGAYATPWACVTLPKASEDEQTTPSPPSAEWTTGTWTTGYWDCCKPSCGWRGKGRFDRPVASCDARTGQRLEDFNVGSVCDNGTAAACVDYAPFVVNPGLSMGFAAVNAKEEQSRCGQCFELRFTNEKHDNGLWGGSSPSLVGKAMVVQVSNTGGDVTGDHSFDIQIPSAGQGLFHSGCNKQFPGYKVDEFDCAKRYGGCKERDECDGMPWELQAGCRWRFDWYGWFQADDTTNNPYVVYRRVRCPQRLIAISGSTPLDDASLPILDEQAYSDGKAPTNIFSQVFA